MASPDPVVVDGVNIPVLGHARAIAIPDDATVGLAAQDADGELSPLTVDDDGRLETTATLSTEALDSDNAQIKSYLRRLLLMLSFIYNEPIPDDPGEV